MANLQVKRKTSLSVTETFILDGAAQDLDSGLPTVVSTAPDGTTSTLTASSSFTGRTTGQYRVVIPAMAEVTYRDLTWTGTIGGQPQTLESHIEWIGDYLFTLPAFRNLKVASGIPFSSTATPLFSDQQIMDARSEVLDEFQDILGFSPVQRYGREVVSVNGGPVVLNQHRVLRVLSVSVNGAAQLASGYYVTPSGILQPVSGYYASVWTGYGIANLAVDYVHGTATMPGGCSRAAMLVAASKLLPDVFSAANTVTTPDGVSVSYEPAYRGRYGYERFYGVNEADRWLNRHRESVAA